MPTIENTGVALFPKMMNVTAAVGLGCPNHVDDVKLVQFALREIFASPHWQKMMQFVPLSGHLDDTTIAWIWFFQNLIRSQGSPVTCDKRVDRANGALGPIHHQVYTIFHLNHQLAQANPAAFKGLFPT